MKTDENEAIYMRKIAQEMEKKVEELTDNLASVSSLFKASLRCIHEIRNTVLDDIPTNGSSTRCTASEYETKIQNILAKHKFLP